MTRLKPEKIINSEKITDPEIIEVEAIEIKKIARTKNKKIICRKCKYWKMGQKSKQKPIKQHDKRLRQIVKEKLLCTVHIWGYSVPILFLLGGIFICPYLLLESVIGSLVILYLLYRGENYED